MKIYVCKYCGRETSNKQSHCGHQVRCPANLNRSASSVGCAGWNRGLTVATDERIANQALRAIGKKGHGVKGYKWSNEAKARISQTRRKEYATGTRKPYGGSGKKQWYVCRKTGRSVYLKSSWEVSFVQYCDLAGIEWEYEPIAFVDEKGKNWFPDFLVEGVLYDPGWRDKSELVKVCAMYGYLCYQVTEEDIHLMRMFL